MKRCIDIFASITGIILLLPVFILLALLIKLGSKGPVFYKQTRVGRNETDFKILKFRTMYQDSDSRGLLTLGGNDKRITSTGKWMRKLKLDELPQLFNVLIGDMSLVGPRPEVRKYVAIYTDDQRKVLTVRPGITDLASIEFFDENNLLLNYNNPELGYIHEIMPIKLNINLNYIKTRSGRLDMKIIFLTVKRIFTRNDHSATINANKL
ncbi:MAG: sugar transferase [Flavitalea sp.]